jgi:putative membrane protein
MPAHVHFGSGSWEFSIGLGMTLLFATALYLRGWIRLRSGFANVIPAWRLGSFLVGLVLLWIALGSPLAAYDHDLLTVHMIKHLLLMTFAPALILLGEPIRALSHGMPRWAHSYSAPLQWPMVRRIAGSVTRPAVCWTVSAVTLIAWHLPVLFTLSLRSSTGHAVEQTTFLVAGLLFWLPVVRPWPSASTEPQWSILLYLFLATLPCDILSGFLVFSDRVAYPVYLSASRHFGFSVLEDQQCAAALMWTCVSLVYLVPAAIISTRLLAPRTSREHVFAQPQTAGNVTPSQDSRSLEVV